MTSKNTVWLPITLNAIYGFFLMLIKFFLPVHLKDKLGFTESEIGFFMALSSIAVIFFIFPAGLGADRFSPKRILQIASLGSILSSIGFIFFKSFWSIAVIFFIAGIARSTTNLAINTEIYKNVDEKKMGSVFGYFHFTIAISVATAEIIGGFVLLNYSFYLAFTLQAIGFFMLFLLSFKLAKTKTVKIEMIHHIKDFLRPHVLVFVFILFLFTMHWGAEEVAYGLFLKHNLGLNTSQMGFYMAGELIFLGLSALFFGYRIQKNKISFKNMLFWGLLLSGITHILMTVEVVWFSAFMRMIHGIGDGAMAIVMFFGIKKLFHVDKIGGSGGLVFLTNVLGAFTGSLIFGRVAEVFGYEWPLIISGLITSCLVFVVFAWQRFFDH